MKKQILSVAAILAVGGILCAPFCAAAQAEAPVKQADVYILAGQSNAAGYSNIKQKVYGQSDNALTYEKQIGQDDTRNGSGYENVLYYGTTNIPASAAMPTNLALRSAKIGLGQNQNYMGPELGMEKVLS